MKKSVHLVLFCFFVYCAAAQTTATFEDILPGDESYYNGSDLKKGFPGGLFHFHNDYNPEWFSWSGFAVSNTTDTVTRGWMNQYSVISGSGARGSDTYAVSYVFGSSVVDVPGVQVAGCYVNNSTYAYYTMKEGDSFSKKFGGETGTDPDWFKLSIAGYNSPDSLAGVVEFYLADYRSDDPAADYILDEWTWVSLESLGVVQRLEFSLASTDNGDWGMNTPAYFCLDDLIPSDLPPVVVQPIENISIEKGQEAKRYYLLNQVFMDPDSEGPLTYEVEAVSDPSVASALLAGPADQRSNEVYLVVMFNGNPGITEIIIAASSNGKKTKHAFTVTQAVPTGMQMVQEGEWRIWPVPFREWFSVAGRDEILSVKIFDQSGRMLVFKEGGLRNEIFINETVQWKRGLYFINVQSKKGSFVLKAIKN